MQDLTFPSIHAMLYANWVSVEFFSYTPQDLDVLINTGRGNCTDRAAVMAWLCEQVDIPADTMWVRMNGVPHLVVVERSSGLVSDHTLETMRTTAGRVDLTDWRPWPDTGGTDT